MKNIELDVPIWEKPNDCEAYRKLSPGHLKPRYCYVWLCVLFVLFCSALFLEERGLFLWILTFILLVISRWTIFIKKYDPREIYDWNCPNCGEQLPMYRGPYESFRSTGSAMANMEFYQARHQLKVKGIPYKQKLFSQVVFPCQCPFCGQRLFKEKQVCDWNLYRNRIYMEGKSNEG